MKIATGVILDQHTIFANYLYEKQFFFHRMSLLLKSLVTVARVTPAYKLSRRQGVDSYVICYRVMLGDPSTPPDLGEGALTARVGQVTTPVSTIVCCVDYRY